MTDPQQLEKASAALFENVYAPVLFAHLEKNGAAVQTVEEAQQVLQCIAMLKEAEAKAQSQQSASLHKTAHTALSNVMGIEQPQPVVDYSEVTNSMFQNEDVQKAAALFVGLSNETE